MTIEQHVVAAWAKRIGERIVADAVSELKGMKGRGGRLLSGDSGLSSVWEEVCVQVQDEHSFYWDFYVETMESLLGGHVYRLDQDSRLALWTSTDEGWDYVYDHRDDDGGAEQAPVSEEAIVAMLMERLLSAAADFESQGVTKFLERHEYGYDELDEPDDEDDEKEEAGTTGPGANRESRSPGPFLDLRPGIAEPVFFAISRRQVERGDIDGAVEFLRSLLPPDRPERVWAIKGRLSLVVDGYGEDPRELYEIPEVCQYLKAIDDLWPFWFFFFSQVDESLPILAMCLASAIEVEPGQAYVDPEGLRRFLERGFSSVNRLFETYGFPPAENLALSSGVLRLFSNGADLEED